MNAERTLPSMVLFVCLCTAAAACAAATPAGGEIPGRLAGSDTLAQALFGPADTWDSTWERWQQWKQDNHLPFTLGAYNWYHANNGGPHASGYGIPGLRGTYFWYLTADPQLSTPETSLTDVGAHVEFRFRDTSDRFRAFFDHTYWFYEAYGYADTPAGRFQGGRIRKRFGLDWDDSWWGNVQYFDGLKLDAGDGLSWENTWHRAHGSRLEIHVQYLFREAGISGSLAGANPQSVPGSKETNVGVVRIVSVRRLSAHSTLSLGLSGLAGEIHNAPSLGPGRSQLAWAADTNLSWNAATLFAEIDQSFGIINPARYVSGGPSNRITDILLGGTWRYGPITFRAAWSAGFDAHPGGRQFLWDPGMIVDLTRNLKLYAEYVRWDSIDSAHHHTVLEDGCQIVLNWHL